MSRDESQGLRSVKYIPNAFEFFNRPSCLAIVPISRRIGTKAEATWATAVRNIVRYPLGNEFKVVQKLYCMQYICAQSIQDSKSRCPFNEIVFTERTGRARLSSHSLLFLLHRLYCDFASEVHRHKLQCPRRSRWRSKRHRISDCAPAIMSGR